MTVKHRITVIHLAKRLDRDKAYAEKIGVSVEMKNTGKNGNTKKQ